ncbi:MAG: CpaD family pilus assembly protein [Caulobacteraceae bacterium]
MRMPLIASLACLAVAACASEAPPLAQARPITPTERYAIQVKPSPVELMLAAHGAGLSDAQAAALRDFMGRYEDADRGAITIKAPEHGPDESGVYRTATATRDFLIAQGALPGDVRIEGYDAGGDGKAPVRVSFLAYHAQGPACGTSWSDLSKEDSNEPYAEFGCAVTANFAAQVADPADLLHPRASDPPDALRRANVLDKYRQAQTTSTPKDPQADGTFSSVGQ